MTPPQSPPSGEPPYDLWHLGFVNLIQQRAPPNFEVQSEVRLSLEPQRADILLLRRLCEARLDDAAQILRTIWPWLARVTLVEFKSPIRSSFRPGDLVRLLSYGAQYQTAHIDDLPNATDLTLLLVVPSLTPTLHRELTRMAWTLVPLGRGYSRIDGAVYTLFVAVTDEVTTAENDDFLGIFSHHPVTNPAAAWWLRNWTKETTVNHNIKDIPGYDEMRAKLLDFMSPEERLAGLTPEQRLAGLGPEQRLAGLAPEQRLAGLGPEQRLAGLPPEQRLAGLPPEQRLAGLAPEQVILALPLELLRALPDDYVRSLPPDVAQAVRRRVARSDH